MAFVFLATHLFNSDKKAYIYENNAALTEAYAEETHAAVQNLVKNLNLIAALAENTENLNEETQKSIKKLFDSDDAFLDLALYKLSPTQDLTKPTLYFAKDSELKLLNISPDDLKVLREEKPTNLQRAALQSVTLQNATKSASLPLLALTFALKNSVLLDARVQQAKLLQLSRRSSTYTTFVADEYANLLAHPDNRRVERHESLTDVPIIAEIIASPLQAGVREFKDASGVAKILAYRKLDDLKIAVFSEVPVSIVLQASSRLIEKSAFFALLILWAAFMVSILFARHITSALKELYRGTEKVIAGNFNFRVAVNSHDEVGSLAKSFNKMTGEITRLLKETAEKARMEKELETAQIVQDNFFPSGPIRIPGLEISSYFRPATECGGDWWGYFPAEKSAIILIGDATGHGVGAALITAAARSCTAVLEWMQQRGKLKNITVIDIMEALNTAVFHTGKGKIKMTFFAIKIDLATGLATYCNASHDRPLFYRAKKTVTKEDFELLAGAPDLCLGQDLATKFTEHQCTLQPGEGLVLHTDGLLECTNEKSEEFGERRFLKSVMVAAAHPAETIKNKIVTDANAFFGAKKLTDDVTVVIIKRTPAQQEVRLAG